VLAPVKKRRTVHAFVVQSGLVGSPNPKEVARALRRAVMARVQQVLGLRTRLPPFFSGHEHDGSPAEAERSPHLAFGFDPEQARLLIVAPHVLDRRDPAPEERRHLADLDAALTDFRELRAGSAGRLVLLTTSIDADVDPLLAASRIWDTVTPYQLNRHTKQVGAAEALSADLREECRRRGLPEPIVTPRDLRGVPGVGLVGGARLTFQVAVPGPIILGRSRFCGGGLFVGRASGNRSEEPFEAE
jgi:CRISPR-associated protein Csb2